MKVRKDIDERVVMVTAGVGALAGAAVGSGSMYVSLLVTGMLPYGPDPRAHWLMAVAAVVLGGVYAVVRGLRAYRDTRDGDRARRGLRTVRRFVEVGLWLGLVGGLVMFVAHPRHPMLAVVLYTYWATVVCSGMGAFKALQEF